MPTEPQQTDIVSEARELLAKATLGPWRVERNTKRLEISPIRPDGQWVSMIAQVYKSGRCNGSSYRMPAEANAELIARAPELLRQLCDEVERLRGEVAKRTGYPWTGNEP